MNRVIRIGQIFGIPLTIQTSWLFLFALIVWSLMSVVGAWHPTWTTGTNAAVALVIAVAFFLSVLVHELAHSLVARAYGLTVREITLHVFGGASNLNREPQTPGAELTIAVVGPLASIVLGAAMVAVVTAVNGPGPGVVASDELASALSRLSPTMTLLTWLGPVNVALGLFNLLPGFPMDGGRILHAALWKATGDVHAATRWAAAAGGAIGVAFIALGALMAFGVRVPLLGSGLTAGIWVAFIGIHLRASAQQQQLGANTARALKGVRVATVMRIGQDSVQANSSIRSLVTRGATHRDESETPVFVHDRYVGVVVVAELVRVPAEQWDECTARDVMREASSFPAIASSDLALEALGKVLASGLTGLPVVDDGRFMGMLFGSDIARWVGQHRPPADISGSSAKPDGRVPRA